MQETIEQIRSELRAHETNRAYTEQGIEPLFVADERARLVVVGHAPGLQAQTRGLAWGDKSGGRLIEWLGIDEASFRDPSLVALLPMDFYYQGKGGSGDRPPRKDFAPLWHPRLLACLPQASLIVLSGLYAQSYYLGDGAQRNLTETVRAYRNYLPRFFPLVHPSPLNNRWLKKNPWFELELIPVLRQEVARALHRV